jgi:molybdate transport system substrate-binding protein
MSHCRREVAGGAGGLGRRTPVARRAVLLLLAAVAAACGTAAPGDQLLVAAASDLAVAMPELAAAFEAETGIRVTASLGATGQLATQIEQGAPVDLFLAADSASVERLAAGGWVDGGGRAVYAFGSLVLLAGRADAPPPDVAALADPAWARIALANPEHAPYGRAARQALERAGVAAAVADRLVLAENVRQAVQFAETRSVDVSLAALALMDPARHRYTRVPGDLHDPLMQTGAVVSRTANAEGARRFLAFVTGDTGRAILRRHSLTPP